MQVDKFYFERVFKVKGQVVGFMPGVSTNGQTGESLPSLTVYVNYEFGLNSPEGCVGRKVGQIWCRKGSKLYAYAAALKVGNEVDVVNSDFVDKQTGRPQLTLEG